MKIEELKVAMEDMLETAKVLLIKDGKLVPVAFMEHHNNIDIIPLSFRDNDEKVRQLSILKDTVKKKSAEVVFMVTESWYVTAESGNLSTEPSKHPMRKECIMMIGECEDGNFSIMQTFDRECGMEDGKIVFGEKIDIEETVSPRFNFGIKDRKKQNKYLKDLN